MSKKTAPVRRTVRSTSDNASIDSLHGRLSTSAGRTIIRAAANARYTLSLEKCSILQGDMAMSVENSYAGACFCGEVKFEASGQPVAMGYCHCESCRHWSAGPINAFTVWKPDALSITHGSTNIGIYHKSPTSYRKWCKKCGGHLFTEHPTMGLVDIYAALIPRLHFESAVHVHYQ